MKRKPVPGINIHESATRTFEHQADIQNAE